jgi:hypothetical protein
MFIIPRVAMKGGSPSLVIVIPLTNPQTAPPRIPMRIPSAMGTWKFEMKKATITEPKVITVPAERSIPPVTIIKVIPTAKMPLTAVISNMVTILPGVKKLGELMVKITRSKIRLEKASTV